jgi:hypothetical protein
MKYTTNTGLLRSEIYAIGLVALHWSHLERAVEQLIWSILELKLPDGRAITADFPMRARLKMLRKLINARHSPMLGIIDDLIGNIHTLEDDRNLIVYGIWGRHDGSSDPSATSLKRSAGSPSMIYGERFPRERMDEPPPN